MGKQDWDKIVGRGLGVVMIVVFGWGLVRLHRAGGVGHFLAWVVPIEVVGMSLFYGFSRWYSTRQGKASPEMVELLKAEEAKP